MVPFFFKFIKSFFGVVCTAITLLQFFVGTDTYKSFAEEYTLPTEITLKIAIILAILTAIMILLYRLILYHKSSNSARKCGKSFHRFCHFIRDSIFQIEAPDYSRKYSSHEAFYQHIGSVCEKACDEIASFLKEKTKKEFSVCIKLLQSANQAQQGNEITAYTLCRSGRDKSDRRENGIKLKKGAVSEHEISTPVKNNTAFQYILNNENEDGKPSIFACSNLLMLKILKSIFGKDKYENPNKNFWKHYLSTIVIPIRINFKIIQYDYPNEALQDYVTIGFLCIDHRWPISKALKNELAEYANGFADTLFDLLYETYKCDKNIPVRAFSYTD